MKIKDLYLFKKSGYSKTLSILLFIYCFFAINLLGQPYPYKFNYLTVDDGLSHTDANDIAQDKNGFIWVATYFGLDRYDGYAVKKFYNHNAPLNNAFKNRIRCVYPDDMGNIWLGTEDGLQCFDPRLEKYTDFGTLDKPSPTFEKLLKPVGRVLYGLDRGQLKSYKIKENSIELQQLYPPKNTWFSDMAIGKNGFIYLSSNNGVWILDKNRQFKNVSITGLTNQNLSKIYFDNRNNLLLASANRVFFVRDFSAEGQNFMFNKQVVCPSNTDIKGIVENGQFDYWINTGDDLFRFDSKLDFIQPIDNKSSLRGLNSHSISKIFIDRSECLWLCTFGGGVNFCDLNEKLFYTLQHNPETTNSLSGNHIRSVLEDGDNIWVGTTANGLSLYNLKTETFAYYNTYNSHLKLKSNTIPALTFDNDHNLWVGSGSGIEILKPDLKEFLKPLGYDRFPTYTIETIVKDCYGNIWFGNHMNRFGVIWKDKKNRYHVKYYGEGYYIFADKSKPQLFISSTHGLKRLLIDNEGNINQTFEYHASNSSNGLSSDYTYPICKQNDSIYWIGTIGGGLDRLSLQPNNTYTIKSYTDKIGIFNDVESLEIDDSGNIWMGGNGLECLNPVTEKLIRYDKNDGLQGNSFKVGSSCKGADGRLYFGGINGLNYFYPNQIKTNTIAAKPILTDIFINNQVPKYGNSDSSDNMIPQTIGFSKTITLNYLQNNFVVSFSSMHYANPLKCRYRYKLVGFNKDWMYTDGKNPTAAYNNLDYGSYQFIMEATNNDGLWSKDRAEIKIIVTPPWWKSNIAKGIYILLVISGLLYIYLYQAKWYRLKRELEVRTINEKKKEEIHQQRIELYQQQLTFFTNISHEFRTPLTLIMGPLEGLMSQNKNTVLNNAYQLMFRNTIRLTNLISELMNFKKVADSVIKLQVQPLQIHQFCDDLSQEFENLAIGKQISFKIVDEIIKDAFEPTVGLFDIQVLEKILFNLLNNAFKYTDVGGQISFEILFNIEELKPPFETGFQLLNESYRAKKYIYFRVADSGIGISSDSITKIFDRYYRISNNHLGSGVGLALVKSLTQLHKGDIYVYSERHKGTEIIIGIPWGEENYDASERAVSPTNLETQLEPIDNSILLPLANEETDNHVSITKTNKHILLVDDNQELRLFLKQTLEKHYFIDEAEDGIAGIEMAIEKMPDLIISDVMMPGMDGIAFCKTIKEKFETSHIPFIILSAKDALSTKIEGMESGADFYFAKPLSIDLLLLTVNNIFEQNEKLKLRYTNNYLTEATELVHSEKDKAFLQTIMNLIEENIQDPDLDADYLCERLFISRTKLYQKIKSVSNQSVAEFVRTIRLKKAIHIMAHEDISMNEVADRIGLQSSTNFSRAFKKEYGKSPIQFIQSLKKN